MSELISAFPYFDLNDCINSTLRETAAVYWQKILFNKMKGAGCE
jgi:hypothetical protein